MKTGEKLLQSVQHDAAVRQIVVGAFWTMVVLDTQPARAGLASTLRSETGGPWPPVVDAGHLLGRSGCDVATLLHSDRILEASIGLAALNALLDADDPAMTEVNAEHLILERGSGRRVAIVGHFPFIERVRQAAADCWVLELHPAPGDLPASQAAGVLPQTDVIALTGTSLINHTFDDLMRFCRPDAFVLLLGPSAPLTPVVFDLGVNAVSGTRIDDPERVLPLVSQGATFRQIKRAGGLRLLTWIEDTQRNQHDRPSTTD